MLAATSRHFWYAPSLLPLREAGQLSKQYSKQKRWSLDGSSQAIVLNKGVNCRRGELVRGQLAACSARTGGRPAICSGKATELER